MNLSTARIFFFFLFLLILTSCANYTINEKQLFQDSKKSVDKNKGDYVVLLGGDTLKNENLRVKYRAMSYATLYYDGKEILENKISCAQTKERFVLYNVKSVGGIPLYRIRVGKINVYYTQTNDSRFTSGSYGSNGQYNVGTTGGTHTIFYFEKEKDKYEIMLDLVNIKSAVSENLMASNLFTKYYPKINSKTWISYKEILKIIDKYNEG